MSLSEYIFYGPYLLLVLTATASYRVFREFKTTQNLNVFLFALTLVVAMGPAGAAGTVRWQLQSILCFVLPYLALRLISEVRDVPAPIERGALGLSLVAVLGLWFWPTEAPWFLKVLLPAAVFLLQIYVTVLFAGEMRRSSGVAARRGGFATVGSAAYAALFLLSTTTMAAPSIGLGNRRTTIVVIAQLLETLTLFGFYMAFSTPRWLKRNWSALESARFLEATHAFKPVDRGNRAMQDLAEAAAKSVTSGIAVVMVPEDELEGTFMVANINKGAPAELLSLTMAPAGSVIGNAMTRGPLAGPVDGTQHADDCLRPYGRRVLAAPICMATLPLQPNGETKKAEVSDDDVSEDEQTKIWGVIAVIQRRGVLFEEDDLDRLGKLGRYTARAKHHALLIETEKRTEKNDAARRLRAAKDQLEGLLESAAGLGTFVVDDKGHVQIWHKGAQHLLGQQADEAIGRSGADFFEITTRQFLGYLAEANERGSAIGNTYGVRRDRSRFAAEVVVKPYEDEQVKGYSVLIQDLTA